MCMLQIGKLKQDPNCKTTTLVTVCAHSHQCFQLAVHVAPCFPASLRASGCVFLLRGGHIVTEGKGRECLATIHAFKTSPDPAGNVFL